MINLFIAGLFVTMVIYFYYQLRLIDKEWAGIVRTILTDEKTYKELKFLMETEVKKLEKK